MEIKDLAKLIEEHEGISTINISVGRERMQVSVIAKDSEHIHKSDHMFSLTGLKYSIFNQIDSWINHAVREVEERVQEFNKKQNHEDKAV